MPENKYCILLTATIAPKNMTFTRRSDPKVREADYLSGIENASRWGLPIIFAENSGYGLGRIKEALERSAPGNYEIVQTTEGQDFPVSRGKGYGELVLLTKAIPQSKLVNKSTYIIKITGRYTIPNLNELIASLESGGDFIVAADYVPGKRYTMSGMFICKAIFLTRYMEPLQDVMDDSKKQPFEMVLRMAIENAVKDGYRCASFTVKPQIEGYSGTWNAKFKKNDYNDVQFSTGKMLIEWRKLRQRFGRRWNILKKIVYTHLRS